MKLSLIQEFPALQRGLAYAEVLVATALIAIALIPAIDALYAGLIGTDIYSTQSTEHYRAAAKMEEVLAEPHSLLLAASAVAGDVLTPSSYSDAPGTPDRCLVFVGLYDAEDDGDGDVFTVADPNLDGDANIFTGYNGVLWVRTEIEGSDVAFESLSAP